MAIAYKSAGAGAGTETIGAQLALACPAVVDANDILVAHLTWLDNASEPTDPSGWARLYTVDIPEHQDFPLGAALGTGTPVGRSYVYGKLAAGTEDGSTVNFGTAGGSAGRFGRIYSFSGYVSGTITDVIPALSFTSSPKEDDPALPTVTTTVAGALAIALIAQDDNNALAAGGAQTGGTWAEPVAEFVSTTIGAQGCVCQIQTCTPTADPGTVSGGVLPTAADESSTIGFEIRPNVPAENITVTPDTASLSITERVPTVTASNHQTVVPSTASLTLTEQVPTVTVGGPVEAVPSPASLSLTEFAPVVTATAHQTVVPNTASLSLTERVPTVTATDHKTVTPTNSTLSLTTHIPVVSAAANESVTPDTAELVLDTFEPLVTATANQLVTPGTLSLVVSKFAPTITLGGNQTVVPSPATLILTRFVPRVLKDADDVSGGGQGNSVSGVVSGSLWAA